MVKCFVLLNGMTEPAEFPVKSAAEAGDYLFLRSSNNEVIGRFHLGDVRSWWTDRELRAEWLPNDPD